MAKKKAAAEKAVEEVKEEDVPAIEGLLPIAEVGAMMVADFESIHRLLDNTRYVRGQGQIEVALGLVQGLAASGRYS